MQKLILVWLTWFDFRFEIVDTVFYIRIKIVCQQTDPGSMYMMRPKPLADDVIQSGQSKFDHHICETR